MKYKKPEILAQGNATDPGCHPAAKKTAGIVADNYKISRFEQELSREGFEFDTKPYLGDTSIIKVSFSGPGEQKQLALLCKRVELYFNKMKN